MESAYGCASAPYAPPRPGRRGRRIERRRSSEARAPPGLTCEHPANNISAMFTASYDEPEEILAFLSDGILGLRDALEDGVSFADGVMDGNPDDPHLWANLVRYRARMKLEEHETQAWSMGRHLRNSGIEIVKGPIVMRALKAQGDAPPHPGASRARRNYWMQQLTLPFDGNDAGPAAGANLVVDWALGGEREILLALSKPIGVWKYRGAPKLEWRLPVVYVDDTELGFQPTDEDVAVEPVFDLTELEEEDSG